MAKIVRTSDDPFHENAFMCENCHNVLLTANAYCDAIGPGQRALARIKWQTVDDKPIPTICPKCLEPLEFPNEIFVPIQARDPSLYDE